MAAFFHIESPPDVRQHRQGHHESVNDPSFAGRARLVHRVDDVATNNLEEIRSRKFLGGAVPISCQHEGSLQRLHSSSRPVEYLGV